MATKPSISPQNYRKALIGLLEQIGRRHRIWQVWSDFVEISALMISNSCDRGNFKEREEQYMRVIERYDVDELSKFAECFAYVVMGLEIETQDLLGSIFMELDLGNNRRGQFFTPYPVCAMMAKVNLQQVADTVALRGYVTMLDPCIGGGAMIIAAADVMHDEGVNFQQHMHATGIDIDIVAVHMAYIQMSLLGIPGIVVHGNSLSGACGNELNGPNVWRTPLHVVGGWDFKLRQSSPAPCSTAPAAPARAEFTGVSPQAPMELVQQANAALELSDRQLTLI